MGVELALELGSDVGRQVGKVQSEMEQRDVPTGQNIMRGRESRVTGT